mmetsp:Transcript_80022/g.193836  ORF Transcript_80022/g.193836 Transcript_80022/m.193836 type:complete len:292 (+) Transcript_80022:186-1061(+)
MAGSAKLSCQQRLACCRAFSLSFPSSSPAMPSSLPAVASGDCRLVSSKTCLSCSPRMGELTVRRCTLEKLGVEKLGPESSASVTGSGASPAIPLARSLARSLARPLARSLSLLSLLALLALLTLGRRRCTASLSAALAPTALNGGASSETSGSPSPCTLPELRRRSLRSEVGEHWCHSPACHSLCSLRWLSPCHSPCCSPCSLVGNGKERLSSRRRSAHLTSSVEKLAPLARLPPLALLPRRSFVLLRMSGEPPPPPATLLRSLGVGAAMLLRSLWSLWPSSLSVCSLASL